MDLKVTWSLPDQPHKAINVYRSDASTSKNLSITGMSPITTLSAGALEYTDKGLAPNTSYYYNIAVVDDEDNETMSTWYNLGTFLTYGPGPQTLRWGDYNLGYFGEVEKGDFIVDQTELETLLGVTGLRWVNNKWFKVAINNKFYILSNDAPIKTYTPTTLVTNGMELANKEFETSNYRYKLVDLLLNRSYDKEVFELESFGLKLLNACLNSNVAKDTYNNVIGYNEDYRFAFNLNVNSSPYSTHAGIRYSEQPTRENSIDTSVTRGFRTVGTGNNAAMAALHIYELQF